MSEGRGSVLISMSRILFSRGQPLLLSHSIVIITFTDAVAYYPQSRLNISSTPCTSR